MKGREFLPGSGFLSVCVQCQIWLLLARRQPLMVNLNADHVSVCCHLSAGCDEHTSVVPVIATC